MEVRRLCDTLSGGTTAAVTRRSLTLEVGKETNAEAWKIRSHLGAFDGYRCGGLLHGQLGTAGEVAEAGELGERTLSGSGRGDVHGIISGQRRSVLDRRRIAVTHSVACPPAGSTAFDSGVVFDVLLQGDCVVVLRIV